MLVCLGNVSSFSVSTTHFFAPLRLSPLSLSRCHSLPLSLFLPKSPRVLHIFIIILWKKYKLGIVRNSKLWRESIELPSKRPRLVKEKKPRKMYPREYCISIVYCIVVLERDSNCLSNCIIAYKKNIQRNLKK